MLDVGDPALVLALGAGPLGRARDRPHIPVARERMQAAVELHLARDRVMVLDHGAGIVEQQLAQQAAEVAERSLDPLQPTLTDACAETPPR